MEILTNWMRSGCSLKRVSLGSMVMCGTMPFRLVVLMSPNANLGSAGRRSGSSDEEEAVLPALDMPPASMVEMPVLALLTDMVEEPPPEGGGIPIGPDPAGPPRTAPPNEGMNCDELQ